ncbi:MAG: glutamate-5-semialdehyde dehydrogenase [Chitinophagales bacterium]|nr:glutamate-5-semialdehyde dehydrogenase [Chitinophagales bacterium]MCZ2393332.1 glutamate-5-semialdehyde dehydrogenase [Chitinophagales bacterium]
MDSILPLLQATRKASVALRKLSDKERQAILQSIATQLSKNESLILSENQKDLNRMDDNNPKKDRLLLNHDRIQGLIESLSDVSKLSDPTGRLISEFTTDKGLLIQKVSVSLGVVGVIYEARPNVTIDVAALCLKSGNAVVLRGGSDAEFTNLFLVKLIHEALKSHGLPPEIVQLLPVDRKFVKEMLESEKYIDIIIPRGSQELIDFVRLHSKVPTIETGAGVCHTYVEASADLTSAANIVVNAKTQRPSVCNSLDTILVDKKVAQDFLPLLIPGFNQFGVEIFADSLAYDILEKENYQLLQHATPENFGMEYLSQKCSVKTVDNIDEALNHIQEFSSKHSEAIVTKNEDFAERFLNEVDAAAVYVNASTRFTDGGVFGLGAEIGISTQKLHARGPFALEKLTTEKWICRGEGQIR